MVRNQGKIRRDEAFFSPRDGKGVWDMLSERLIVQKSTLYLNKGPQGESPVSGYRPDSFSFDWHNYDGLNNLSSILYNSVSTN